MPSPVRGNRQVKTLNPAPTQPSPAGPQTTGGPLMAQPSPPGTYQQPGGPAFPVPEVPSQWSGTSEEWGQYWSQAGGGGARPQHGPGYNDPNYPQFADPTNWNAYQQWYGTLVGPDMSWDSFQSNVRNDQLFSQWGVPRPFGLRHRPDLEPAGALEPGQYQEGLDPMGFPLIGRLPSEHIAPQMQFLAERQAAIRNERLGQSALGALYGGQEQGVGALQQGLANLQSYRPGGAAALMSGMYGQMANVYTGTAGQAASTYLNMRQSAPDLMHFWRQQQAGEAARAERRAGYVQLAGQLGGALIGAAGAALGGLAGGGAAQQPPGPNFGYGVASGGTVPARPGGTEVTVGEGGQAEHIVPDSQKQEFAARVQGEPQPSGQSGAPSQPQAVIPPPPGQMGLANSFTMDGIPPPLAMEHVMNMVTDIGDMNAFLDGIEWTLKNQVA